MLVFALGIKAVGKSHLVAEMNKLGAGITEVSYGDAMLEIAKSKFGVKDREQIAKLPAKDQNEIRDAAAKSIRKLAESGKLVFLNTHGFIYTIPNHTYLPGSPDKVSDILKPDFVLLVEASPDTIIERRQKDLAAGRAREIGTRKEVEEAMLCEKFAALHIGVRYGVEVKLFDNTPAAAKNASSISALAQLFKALQG